jgi:hypothetical protein
MDEAGTTEELAWNSLKCNQEYLSDRSMELESCRTKCSERKGDYIGKYVYNICLISVSDVLIKVSIIFVLYSSPWNVKIYGLNKNY